MKTAADEATTLASSDLGSLYEDYWPSLLRTAWMMTGSKDEAET